MEWETGDKSCIPSHLLTHQPLLLGLDPIQQGPVVACPDPPGLTVPPAAVLGTCLTTSVCPGCSGVSAQGAAVSLGENRWRWMRRPRPPNRTAVCGLPVGLSPIQWPAHHCPRLFHFLTHFSLSLTCTSWDPLLDKMFPPKSWSQGLPLGSENKDQELTGSNVPCWPPNLRWYTSGMRGRAEHPTLFSPTPSACPFWKSVLPSPGVQRCESCVHLSDTGR